MCHSAIVDNVVTYVCAKFSNDRLWNEKALADHKSDNNPKKNNSNNVGSAWGPVSGSKKLQCSKCKLYNGHTEHKYDCMSKRCKNYKYKPKYEFPTCVPTVHVANDRQ